MNLIHDAWMTVRHRGGSQKTIAPWQITDADIIEIIAMRPDFTGALYQFVIGQLQTAFAPEDEDQWQAYWQAPPEPDQLKAHFDNIAPAFEVINPDGPAFMQDYCMPDGEQKSVSGLLIEAPGSKTLNDNLDHFVKGGFCEGLCPACAATALFTLQTNAPSGGQGHRVGLRGGGPLTTLIRQGTTKGSLWDTVWLNVLNKDDFFSDNTASENGCVFPWLEATRLSDKKGSTTLPGDVNPLQMYWGMPRRIRWQASNTEGKCSLCHSHTDTLLTHYRTKNYGINYEGCWQHPLTPYKFDLKKQKDPLSLKGQQGGLGYRHWLGLLWQDGDNGDHAAKVVQVFNNERAAFIEEETSQPELPAALWCFGFDMDNMKARCWYDHQMPVLRIEDNHQEAFIGFVYALMIAAKDVVSLLRKHVKEGWFRRPGDVKGSSRQVDQSFWEATESAFYQQLYLLAQTKTQQLPPAVAEGWVKKLRLSARELFDHWVLNGCAEDMDMQRIITTKIQLNKKLCSIKSLKNGSFAGWLIIFEPPAEFSDTDIQGHCNRMPCRQFA